MMPRLLVCMVAAMLALLPAAAQQFRSNANTFELTAAALTVERMAPDEFGSVAPQDDRSLNEGQKQTLAAAIFNALAVRNSWELGIVPASGMDAFLRPPDGEASGNAVALFHRARALYDAATSIRTSIYDLQVDPLSLRCQVRFRLSRAFSRGSN